MRKLQVATRGSKLALAQTNLVINSLRQKHTELEVEIVTITTTGDKDQISDLHKISDIGFFTKQVEQALLENKADFAVHSFKDLPTKIKDGLTVAATPERLYPQDVMVSRTPVNSIADLSDKAIVGTSSCRRTAEIKHLRPDITIKPIRGNVDTRLRKLFNCEYDAIILARAGLERVGVADRISFVFDPKKFIPAAAQGSLAIQCRSDDSEVFNLLKTIDHDLTSIAVNTERSILAKLQPGCNAPVGVYAEIINSKINIYSFVSNIEAKNVIMKNISGSVENHRDIAAQLAAKLIEAGAIKLLEKNDD